MFRSPLFLLLVYAISIALRVWLISRGGSLWPSIGMEAFQLGMFTVAWLALRSGPEEKQSGGNDPARL